MLKKEKDRKNTKNVEKTNHTVRLTITKNEISVGE